MTSLTSPAVVPRAGFLPNGRDPRWCEGWAAAGGEGLACSTMQCFTNRGGRLFDVRLLNWKGPTTYSNPRGDIG
jgi:hypothetical protein